MVYGLAALSWIIYNYVGIQKHGFLGYLKLQCVPGGITGPILALLIPLEFMSNLIVRPITLALRLLREHVRRPHPDPALRDRRRVPPGARRTSCIKPVGLLAWLLFIAISFLELLVQFLQAYVFVLLNAMYISGALADEH